MKYSIVWKIVYNSIIKLKKIDHNVGSIDI